MLGDPARVLGDPARVLGACFYTRFRAFAVFVSKGRARTGINLTVARQIGHSDQGGGHRPNVDVVLFKELQPLRLAAHSVLGDPARAGRRLFFSTRFRAFAAFASKRRSSHAAASGSA